MIVKYCQYCGGELTGSELCPKCSPGSAGDVNGVNKISTPAEKRPWYFSTRFKIIMFVLFPPVWSLFVFADKQSPKGVKYFAAALWLVLIGSLWGTYSLESSVSPGGDGTIYFGSTVQNLKITDPKRDFTKDEEIKWATQLSNPLGTTIVDLTLSRKLQNGGESPVGNRQLKVSSPDFDLLSSDLDLQTFYFLSDIKSGAHVLRVVAKDKVVAKGEFTITDNKTKKE